MKQTTIYLPDELKQRLTAAAAQDGRSEASIVREALEVALSLRQVRPSLPLFDGDWGDPTLAERVDEVLEELRSDQ